jgi:hypothetical protein
LQDGDSGASFLRIPVKKYLNRRSLLQGGDSGASFLKTPVKKYLNRRSLLIKDGNGV